MQAGAKKPTPKDIEPDEVESLSDHLANSRGTSKTMIMKRPNNQKQDQDDNTFLTGLGGSSPSKMKKNLSYNKDIGASISLKE